MQTNGRPSTIRIRPADSRLDQAIAVGIFKPGHLLKFDSAGKVLKHATVGGWAEKIFAEEDALQGKTVTDAYAVDDVASFFYPAPGNIVMARLPQGQDIAIADPLVSGGDGTLIKASLIGNTLLYSSVAESAEHENTLVAADFDKTYSIPANSLRAGDVLHIKAHVTVNDNNSTDTLTLLLTIGGTTIATTGAVDVADLDTGFFDAYVTIRTIGASGTMVASGTQGLGVPGTVTAKPFALASTTIDTTAAKVIAVNADWSVAHADNEASLSALTVELLRSSNDVILAVAEEAVDNDPGTDEAFIKVRVL